MKEMQKMDDEEKIFTDAKVHTQIILNNYKIKTEEILKKAIDEVCTMSTYINVDKGRLAKILQMENNLIYDGKNKKKINLPSYNGIIYELFRKNKIKGIEHLLLPLNHSTIIKKIRNYFI